MRNFGKELSVFYRDGHDLVMTHFCNAGNQPRLRLSDISSPNRLVFEMFDITNLKNETAAHVQRVIYTFESSDKYSLELVWRREGKEESELYQIRR